MTQALQGQLELVASRDPFSQSTMAASDWKVKHSVFKPLCPPPMPTEDITSQSQQTLPGIPAGWELKTVLSSVLQVTFHPPTVIARGLETHLPPATLLMHIHCLWSLT